MRPTAPSAARVASASEGGGGEAAAARAAAADGGGGGVRSHTVRLTSRAYKGG
tara:strand:- start:316 stop:474 length:159 start_codon:yes stop_codon:yes gene_type:complete